MFRCFGAEVHTYTNESTLMVFSSFIIVTQASICMVPKHMHSTTFELASG